MWDSMLFEVLSYAVSVLFVVVLLTVPANSGNLVAAIFLGTLASFLRGEEKDDAAEADLEDRDI